MKFKRVIVPAHTDYALARVRGEQRDSFYVPRVYSTREEAQREANRMNTRRDVERHGVIVVEEYHYKESVGFEGFLPL
jgi:hypothetical protein